jgi:hypothetical protein
MATDFGRCISVVDGLPLRWKYITGKRVVAEAVLRRWSTERRSLPYDLDYGTDARAMIGDSLTSASIGEWQSALAAEAVKDDRVEDCDVVITYDRATETALVTASITTADGPFRLVSAIDAVTVNLLRIV